MENNNNMLKLQGNISYEITLGPDGYKVSFNDLKDNEDIQNALAAVVFTRKIAEGTVANMKETKETNRKFFNENFKAIFHDSLRTARELKTLESGIVDDLIVQHKIIIVDEPKPDKLETTKDHWNDYDKEANH